ncbi:thiopeptide-type bacteriocin biosynthesis domain-containing protein [Amycolatopsis xylanica]|uniref:Thiopeptide-type bacteriocin biosynthesis domain-containing protein n=1 Tax=Amycolatopsis xylanica TaxID=589385 RepID=A0A1H3P8S4_9PSEU|nr:thiopeptide-type bacteriocin biosynthesis protein [Amycolatopsis xylanica]SDY97574.1 thiopeptide-type bacteriocin biosynthesis domain-containing protein [Amycolatopsis xylanica]
MEWTSLHCFLHCTPEVADEFLLADVAPLLADQAWFFIRYGEGGPHLRIRVRDADPDLADRLHVLASKLPELKGSWPSKHGEVREIPYVPETSRYGGPLALPIAEEVFTESTQVALRVIAETPVRADRLSVATTLAVATGRALGMDRLETARWLRRHSRSWQHAAGVSLLPAPVIHAKVNAVYAGQRQALIGRIEDAYAPDWSDAVSAADSSLDLGEARTWVWASQLHMLFNRMGVVPDEERAVCLLTARALLDDDETFFGEDGPDTQYLEHSKFHIGARAESAAKTIPVPERSGGTPLPHSPLPPVLLGETLTSRVSTRGALTGPLTANDLGTLLWNAHAETHRTGGHAHRPYPSAGALYTARLRLFAMAVDGVEPGCYEVVPENRALRRVGNLPSTEDLSALSGYLLRPPDDPYAINVEAAPVMLGLYVDLGVLRQRYGLRALRLGLLEAGHLAQTLLLVAAALGLGGTPINGFNDDLAHELLGLDDLTQPLQYLVPLGRL